MPHLTVNGCRYFYIDTGTPEHAPDADTVVFGHGFLMTHRLFEHQIEALRDRYRCIAFDWRGQGQSEVTSRGYDLWSLTDDAAALIEALDAAPCHYVGLSMGGYVGFRLALLQEAPSEQPSGKNLSSASRPGLLRSLSLLDTQAGAEPPAKRLQYYLMLAFVRLFGYQRLLMERVLPILFGPTFLNDPARQVEIERWKEIVTSNDRRGVFRTGLQIFSRADLLDRIHRIHLPTLLVVGEDDVATPPSTARAALQQLPDAELHVIPDSGHSSTIEQPEVVTQTLKAFLEQHSA